jgi:Rrf2 family nitric oxide-sensitive transcriptional repressor
MTSGDRAIHRYDCGSCVIARACGLTGVLKEALAAFLTVLDGYTLSDLIMNRQDMGRLLAESLSP